MKRTRKSAKKPVKQATWGDKLDEAWGWTKDLSSTLWTKLMGTAFDDEFPLGLGLVLDRAHFRSSNTSMSTVLPSHTVRRTKLATHRTSNSRF